MKKVSYFKSRYKRAKTSKGRTSVMNRAMLNLTYSEQQKFVAWQVKSQK